MRLRFLLCFAFVLFTACAVTKDTGELAKGEAAQIITTVYDGWIDFDLKHQRDFVAEAKTMAEYNALVEAYRNTTQSPIVKVFKAIRQAAKDFDDFVKLGKTEGLLEKIAALHSIITENVKTLRTLGVPIDMEKVPSWLR